MKKEYNESAKSEYRRATPRKLENPVPFKIASPATMMFAEILITIAVRRYGVNTSDMEVFPLSLTDGGIDLAFSGKDVSLTEELGFKDPDDYTGFQDMLMDLKALNNDPRIRIDPDTLNVVTSNKTALHKLLVDFLDEDNLCMTTLDDSQLVNTQGQDIVPALRGMFKDEPEKYQAHFLGGDREMEAGSCASVMCHSIEDFYLQILKVEAADIPISFEHLLKTIQQEDHSVPAEINKYTFLAGGYN